LERIYGEETGRRTLRRLEDLLNTTVSGIPRQDEQQVQGLPLDERDALVITYGDSLKRPGKSPLACLRDFAEERLRGVVSGLHILPFFPYSSDDGFSIIDYYQVNPELGGWDEIRDISKGFKIMSDLVLNHCSVSSPWFEAFLRGEPEYRNFFIDVDPATDLSMIARPRTHPLLTPFETKEGIKHVWTTFSADQVDLNFAEPEVLLEMLRVMLYHIQQGVRIIRLDAIAYLWKEIGHPSIHHEKTHAVVKLFRAVIDRVAPWVVIITETNVPHRENISYFGNMDDEAHMVYQFSLPPLVLDAFLRENGEKLKKWARELPEPDGKTTFFNFLASHDGIGLLPAHGILSSEEIEGLVENTRRRGGLINYKSTPQGEIPYEMNITYLDAVAERDLPVSVRARKFLASQAVMLSLPGVPGIYIHSLLGSQNYREGVERSGQNRSINRQKLEYSQVEEELDTPGGLRNRIFSGFEQMLQARRASRAFHPGGGMRVLSSDKEVLALLRIAPDESQTVLVLINLSPSLKGCRLPEKELPKPIRSTYTELIRRRPVTAVLDGEHIEFQLEGFGVYWLQG